MKMICQNREDLPDIREISIDGTLSPVVRTAVFMGQVREPNLFRVGDTVVELGWADTKETLQSALHGVLQARC